MLTTLEMLKTHYLRRLQRPNLKKRKHIVWKQQQMPRKAPCTTIARPLQRAAPATHRDRRSKGSTITAADPDLAGARGKTEIAANQKTPKLPDMERAAQEQNSYEKQMKRSTLQSAICTESRPVGLGEVRTRPYRLREQRRKKDIWQRERNEISTKCLQSRTRCGHGQPKGAPERK